MGMLGDAWDKTKEYGGAALDTALNVLDAPSNALQGAVAEGYEGFVKGGLQQKDYDYLDSMSPEFKAENPRTAAALGVAGDILADPLNLVGAGLFTKGSKALKAEGLTRDAYKRGYTTAGASNYIDNYYGISEHEFKEFLADNPNFMDTIGVDLKTGAMAKKLKLTPNSKPKEVVAAYKKITGFGGWAGDSVKDAIKFHFNPYSRALYAQHGIHGRAQQLIRKHLEDSNIATSVHDKSVANRKAIAQAEHELLMAVRANKPEAVKGVLARLSDKIYHRAFVPFSGDEYAQVIKEASEAKKAPRSGKSLRADKRYGNRVAINTEINKRAMEYVANAWQTPLGDPRTLMAVKKGHHDVYSHLADANRSNKGAGAVRKAMAEMKEQGIEITDDSLMRKLAEMRKANPDGGWVLMTDTADKLKRDGGIFIKTTGNSQSFTEGGINLLTHIKPKTGQGTVYISDKMDFLERVPGVKHVTEGIGPKGHLAPLSKAEITVVEPIPIDLKSNSTFGYSLTDPKTASSRNVLESGILEEIAALEPDAKVVKAMAERDLGRATLVAGATDPDMDPMPF